MHTNCFFVNALSSESLKATNQLYNTRPDVYQWQSKEICQTCVRHILAPPMSKDQNSISMSNLFKMYPVTVSIFSFSRIALISTSNGCCYGTSKPRGPLAVMIRHLKILGYDCVLVRLTQFHLIIHRIHPSLKCHHISYIVDNGSGVTVYV